MSRNRNAILERRLARIDALDAPALRAEWTALFGHAAPARLSRDLSIRAIAYRMQEQMCGGFRPATVRRLHRLAQRLQAGETIRTAPAATLPPGVRLMREWNGETHVVEVLAHGFAWRGTRYRSLSAVARAITGARWSGPRFFGLKETSQTSPSAGDRER